MKSLLSAFSILTTAVVISCVTINIYFPAEEVRGAADKIVNEVWGERAEQSEETAPEIKDQPGSSLRIDFGPKTAYAEQAIDVSTPEIRAIRQAMKERAAQLFSYLDSGHVGVGFDALLKLRSGAGLDLRSRGEVNRLIKAENSDRLRLYSEIARANGFPDKAGEVQEIFANSWRDQAAKGWYIEQADGSWTVD